jgi:RNA polymerase primary sigma factor
MGLITAAGRYDETKGFKFISYAVWWIRQSINAAIAEHARIVRLPYNQLALLNKLYKAFSKLEQDHGRKPSVEELAEYLELSSEKVSELLSKSGTSVSIDEPFRQGEEPTLLDVLQNNETPTDGSLMDDSLTKGINESLNTLSERERKLIVLYFGLGSFSSVTLEEIGKRFNLTKEHVGRLKEKALNKLRNSANASVLLSCLG